MRDVVPRPAPHAPLERAELRQEPRVVEQLDDAAVHHGDELGIEVRGHLRAHLKPHTVPLEHRPHERLREAVPVDRGDVVGPQRRGVVGAHPLDVERRAHLADQVEDRPAVLRVRDGQRHAVLPAPPRRIHEPDVADPALRWQLEPVGHRHGRQRRPVEHRLRRVGPEHHVPALPVLARRQRRVAGELQGDLRVGHRGVHAVRVAVPDEHLGIGLAVVALVGVVQHAVGPVRTRQTE